MSDTTQEKSCSCGSKLGLVNLVLNVVILAILLIRFVGCHHHHHHFFGGWHHGGPAFACPAGFQQPGFPPPHPGFGGPMHGPGGFEHGPALTPDAVLDHFGRLLSLTDDQKAKLKPIVADTVAALDKNRQERKEAAEKIIEAAKAKALPILTPEQKKILDSLPQHRP